MLHQANSTNEFSFNIIKTRVFKSAHAKGIQNFGFNDNLHCLRLEVSNSIEKKHLYWSSAFGSNPPNEKQLSSFLHSTFISMINYLPKCYLSEYAVSH
jgi:hypothetical protein